MSVVTRMQLFCDGDHEIDVHYPEDGAIDGAIMTPGEMRSEAKKDGWGRIQNGAGYIDLCPTCNEVHRKERLLKVRKIHV